MRLYNSLSLGLRFAESEAASFSLNSTHTFFASHLCLLSAIHSSHKHSLHLTRAANFKPERETKVSQSLNLKQFAQWLDEREREKKKEEAQGEERGCVIWSVQFLWSHKYSQEKEEWKVLSLLTFCFAFHLYFTFKLLARRKQMPFFTASQSTHTHTPLTRTQHKLLLKGKK